MVLVVSMVLLAIWSVFAILIFALQCRPLKVAWGGGTGTCLPGAVIANAGYAISALDITFSWFYAVSLLTLR